MLGQLHQVRLLAHQLSEPLGHSLAPSQSSHVDAYHQRIGADNHGRAFLAAEFQQVQAFGSPYPKLLSFDVDCALNKLQIVGR